MILLPMLILRVTAHDVSSGRRTRCLVSSVRPSNFLSLFQPPVAETAGAGRPWGQAPAAWEPGAQQAPCARRHGDREPSSVARGERRRAAGGPEPDRAAEIGSIGGQAGGTPRRASRQSSGVRLFFTFLFSFFVLLNFSLEIYFQNLYFFKFCSSFFLFLKFCLQIFPHCSDCKISLIKNYVCINLSLNNIF